MGPCSSAAFPSVDAVLVVGFPDSLVSRDPSNQVGVLAVGDSVVLRLVHVKDSPFGESLYQYGCSQPTVTDSALTWAVSDSSVASAARLNAGEGVVRARNAGRFNTLTYVGKTPPTDQRFWNSLVVACPSGRLLTPIVVNASPRDSV